MLLGFRFEAEQRFTGVDFKINTYVTYELEKLF